MDLANSKRLSYELMTEQDAELLFDLDQDPKVMRYINGGKPSTRDDISDVFIPRIKRFTDHKNGFGLWKVTPLDEQNFIGWLLVRPMSFINKDAAKGDIELGWRFKSSAWGRGYATEAASNLADRIAKNESVQCFTSIAVEDNTPSIKIMKKLGMRYIEKKSFDDPLLAAELVVYRVLKDELIRVGG